VKFNLTKEFLMYRSIKNSYFIAALMGFIISGLVSAPFASYARSGDASKLSKSEAIRTLIQNKSVLQSHLRTMGDFYEAREFVDGVSMDQIKQEIVNDMDSVMNEHISNTRKRTDLPTIDKETKIKIYQAKLELEKKNILNDRDFSAKDYYYNMADRLESRDIDFIPFQKDDRWYESVVDCFLFLIGVGLVVLIVGGVIALLAASDHHDRHDGHHCSRVWVPGYYDHHHHWQKGHYERNCP